jgi:hypothetical protein
VGILAVNSLGIHLLYYSIYFFQLFLLLLLSYFGILHLEIIFILLTILEDLRLQLFKLEEILCDTVSFSFALRLFLNRKELILTKFSRFNLLVCFSIRFF